MGKKSDQVASTCKFQGWSIEGIWQFNYLYDLVDQERELQNGKDFESDFLSYCTSVWDSKTNKSKQRKTLNYEVCRHELWERNTATTSIKNDSESNQSENEEDDEKGSSDKSLVGLNFTASEQVWQVHLLLFWFQTFLYLGKSR